jgi:hypothetical protein
MTDMLGFDRFQETLKDKGKQSQTEAPAAPAAPPAAPQPSKG